MPSDQFRMARFTYWIQYCTESKQVKFGNNAIPMSGDLRAVCLQIGRTFSLMYARVQAIRHPSVSGQPCWSGKCVILPLHRLGGRQVCLT